MSFKRCVLSALGKDVLLEIGRGLELDVTPRMGVEELRDALAKSKRAKLDAIVQESLSMFAEDIGLLPRNYFTSLLYDGARSKDVARRLQDCIEPPPVRS